MGTWRSHAAKKPWYRRTIKQIPRRLCMPTYNTAYNQDYYINLRTHLHEFNITHDLTVGADRDVTWCDLHNCKTEAGTCDQCANIAQGELTRYCNEHDIARLAAIASERIQHERTTKGWSRQSTGRRFTFALIPAWDEFYFDTRTRK